MGIVRNQSIKNATIFYIGMAIGAINTVIIYPNVFHDEPEHWGLIQILIAYAFVASTFSQLGVPKTYMRFFPTIQDKGQFLFFGIVLSISGFILSLLAYYLFKDQLFEYLNASELLISNFHYVIILMFCISFFELFTSVSCSYLNAVTPTFLNEIFLKSYSLIILLLHGFQVLSFPKFLQFFILGYAVKMLLLIVLQLKHNRTSISFTFKDLQLKEMINFGFYVIIGGTSAMLISKVDMIMINKYLDLEHVAYYTVAFFIGNAIKIPARSLVSISVPLLAKAWENKDMQQLQLLYTKSAINLLIVGGFFFLVVWLNIDDILLLLPDKFSHGKYVVLFIGLGQLFNISSGLNGSIIINSKYYRWDLIFNLFLLVVTIITNMLFIPESSPLSSYSIVGINGAAFATALSILLFNILKMLFLYLKLDMIPFTIKTIYTLLLLSSVYILVDCIPFPSIETSQEIYVFTNIILRSLVVFMLFTPIMIKLKLSEDINKLIIEVRKKISR
jgi:O-antigen/teichoic acid export membrane protein